MKKIIIIAVAAISLVSCSDYFNPDNESVVGTGKSITTQRDAFYQMCGILKSVQNLGDGYVIKGELRGDLMTTTSNSTQDLRDIENFSADTTNTYYDRRKLYEVVNNCNYLINYIDTTIQVKGTKVLKYEYAQAKSIRAWAYLQLCLDYGEAYYYTSPVLDSEDKVNGNTLKLDALCDTLIADLLPYVPEGDADYEPMPSYGTIGSVSSRLLFIPVRFMLGELYMWKQDFSKAAEMYYELMLSRRMQVRSAAFANTWKSTTLESTTLNWKNQFSSVDTVNYSSIISYNANTGYIDGLSNIADMCDIDEDYLIKPSSSAISNWNDETYCFTADNVTKGDLRGLYGSYDVKTVAEGNNDVDYSYITKFSYMKVSNNPYLILSRSALVYLRYAEAVNRLGKHQLAFAVLKYGLNRTVMLNANYIDDKEKTGENFTDFGQITANRADAFSGNGALHDRGCGSSSYNGNFKITGITDADSTLCVEDFIMKEYALECAFEGNRFHDLMRIASYRNQPSYLAEKVAQKFPSSQRASIIAKLSDKSNWYLINAARY